MKIQNIFLSLVFVFAGCASNRTANRESTNNQIPYAPKSTEELINSVLAQGDPPIRGVKYNPKATIKMDNTVSMLLPLNFNYNYVKHKSYNYPVYSFVHMCPGQNPCLSSIYIVSIIPENIFTYDDLVDKARSEDFAPNSIQTMSNWIESDKSGSTKKIILFGGNPLMGNSIEGFYYDSKRNLTIKVQSLTIYNVPFSDSDWRRILVHNLVIFSSIRLL